MADARFTTQSEATALLATPQLGTFLTPDQREVVLRALADTHDWMLRALGAEAKLERLRETLNGTPAPARKEDAPPPGAPPPNVQVAGGCTDDLCKCGHTRGKHAAGETFCVGDGDLGPPAKGNCWCLKFQPKEDSHEDLGGDGERVAGEDGLSTAREDPEAPGEEQDREAGAGRLAGDDSPEGGPPTPGGVAKWGRVADPGAAWHLWRESAGEAECGETTDGEIAFLTETGAMPAEDVCLDCAAIVGLALPQEDPPEPKRCTDRNGTAPRVRCGLPAGHEGPHRFAGREWSETPPPPPKPTCDGINKSAGVRCGTTRVSVQRDGKHFCKRHGKAKEAAVGS